MIETIVLVLSVVSMLIGSVIGFMHPTQIPIALLVAAAYAIAFILSEWRVVMGFLAACLVFGIVLGSAVGLLL